MKKYLVLIAAAITLGFTSCGEEDCNHFGEGKSIVDGMEQILRAGDVITIAAGCKHTVEAITALDIVEVQIGDEISVADKIKFDLQ